MCLTRDSWDLSCSWWSLTITWHANTWYVSSTKVPSSKVIKCTNNKGHLYKIYTRSLIEKMCDRKTRNSKFDSKSMRNFKPLRPSLFCPFDKSRFKKAIVPLKLKRGRVFKRQSIGLKQTSCGGFHKFCVHIIAGNRIRCTRLRCLSSRLLGELLGRGCRQLTPLLSPSSFSLPLLRAPPPPPHPPHSLSLSACYIWWL